MRRALTITIISTSNRQASLGVALRELVRGLAYLNLVFSKAGTGVIDGILRTGETALADILTRGERLGGSQTEEHRISSRNLALSLSFTKFTA